MKKELCFFLGVTSNIAFAAGNVAIGLNKYMSQYVFDIVIYHSGLADNDLNTLLKIPKVVLREFNLPQDFVKYMLTNLPEECRFRDINKLMCYAHLEAFNLLDEYETVVWLDADITIQDNIYEVIQYIPFGVPADLPFDKEQVFNVGDQFTKDIDRYDMKTPAIRVSMMVVNDQLPYREIYNWCYTKSLEYCKYLKNPEQAILNIMLQEFNVTPKLIPLELHCDCRRDIAAVTKSVHYGSEQKVWNDINIFNVYPEWYRIHRKWVELGGTDCFLNRKNEFCLSNVLMKLRSLKNKYSHLFVFEFVPYQSNIILYGIGNVGREYIEQIKETRYCNIMFILDKNYDKPSYGDIPVYSPAKILETNGFDVVVIAIESPRIAEEVKECLMNFGVPEKKIINCNQRKSG